MDGACRKFGLVIARGPATVTDSIHRSEGHRWGYGLGPPVGLEHWRLAVRFRDPQLLRVLAAGWPGTDD